MSAATGHIDSYYAASAPLPPTGAALQGAQRADVCVAGGGIAGCSAALHLAERGYRVLLLEAERIGWGASGRSGGQVLPGYSIGLAALEAHLGQEGARQAWTLSVTAVQRLRQRIAQHGIECDWVAGQLHVADKARQVRELEVWQEELATRLDYQGTRLLGREDLRPLLASERYRGALFDPNAGHVHPLRYVLGLARAAQAAGVTVHEHSHAIDWQRAADGRISVRTAQGSVSCEHLILAGGATLAMQRPELGRKILPVGTYIVATEPLGAERAAALIGNNASVADLNWIIDYFRRSADHRLLFGGRVSYAGLHSRDTGRATRQRMLRVFPQLADVRIDYHWGGYLDITFNRAPHFGQLDPRVWFMQGFSGHGLALTGLAGELVAEAVAGSSERFDLYTRIRHRDFPGGPALRRPLLMLAMLWYRLRDLL